MKESSKYRVGEFSKKTGLSIRTLHYYDEIGLLKPERDTSSGHRIYTYQDLLTLQKIMNLKFVGYGLEEITQMLHESSFTISLNETLTLHMNQLEQNKEAIDRSLQSMKRVAALVQKEGKVDSSILFSLVQHMQTEDKQKDWMEKNQLSDWVDYLSNKTEDEKKSLDLSTVQVYKEIKQLCGMPVEKPEVQAVIQRYLEASLAHTGKEVIESIPAKNLGELDFNELEKIAPSPLTEAEEEWLGQALEYYMIQVGGDWRSRLY